jgi:hypothetical protein
VTTVAAIRLSSVSPIKPIRCPMPPAERQAADAGVAERASRGWRALRADTAGRSPPRARHRRTSPSAPLHRR